MSDTDGFEIQLLTALATAPSKRTVDDEIVLHHTLDEIRRLRAELAEHARRAALVEQWADGLRSGKRYAVTVDGNATFYTFTERGYDGFMLYDVWGDGNSVEPPKLVEEDPARAAAYMLAVSENWTEVTHD